MTNKLRPCDWCNKNSNGENPGFEKDTGSGLMYIRTNGNLHPDLIEVHSQLFNIGDEE